MDGPWGWGRLVPALLLAVLLGLPAHAQAAPRKPLGSALWFACTQPHFAGPRMLRCPHPYDPRYEATALRDFDRFTPENELKMAYLQPARGRFDFSVMDQLLQWAQAHHRQLRGHTLIWHDALPLWLAHVLLPWNRPALLGVMRAHIETVIGHARAVAPGVIGEWDVVNEPLAADGTLRRSLWERSIGPDYVALALEAARAADPAAKLVVNDYDTDVPGAKADGMLRLVEQLEQQHAPLDAVGIQGHRTVASAPTRAFLDGLFHRYAALGVGVEVTELDVTGGTAAQRNAVYRRYAAACGVAPNCSGVTVWGVADPYSWRGANAGALLLDGGFHPKPVLRQVRRALTGRHRHRRG